MNLFELFVKIGVDDQASGKLKDLGGKLGNGLKTAAKIGTAAVGAAAAGITALTTAAVNNYAEYEQLVGGVETLFKSSSDTVVQYAQNAYKTAGLSANDYMNTVTSFSASLLQSLGGDTDAAAKKADVAITDMADNANKMGTSIEMLQTTYAGFAKQNFTMLDNLKLGYGGTKEEMQRLLDDASKISGIKYDISSFADITDAIHVMQEEMGIAGATALEAGTTIQGSIGAMKAAWTNLITGLADGNADIGLLVDNLVTTIVGDGTEENLGVFGNIMPAVRNALTGASTLIGELLPQVVQIIPSVITENLPILAEAAISIIQSLANGIAESLPELIPAVIEVILKIVEILTDPANLGNILDAALTILTELAYGLMDAIPQLVDAVLEIIIGLQSFLTDPENLAKIITAAVEIVLAIATGLINAIPQLLTSAVELITSLIDIFKETDWAQVGKDVVNGIWDGLKRMWNSMSEWFSGAWDELVGGVKDLLGIHSPSRVFADIGKNMALGVGSGWEDKFGDIKKDIDKSLIFDDAAIGISAFMKSVPGLFGGRSNYGGVSVIQNIYSEAKTAADLMQEALYQQERAVLLGV